MTRRSAKLLKSIYFDPREPGGLSSIDKLYRSAKIHDNSITRTHVKDWLRGQHVYNLHHPARRYWTRNRIIVSGPHVQAQADLCDMQSFRSSNSDYGYVLTFIDEFSKYALARPLRTKSKEAVADALDEILSEYHVERLQTDRGTEFKNSLCVKRVMMHGTFLYFTQNQDIKCAIVERFNRTLKARMFRYFTSAGSHNWINVLQDLVDAYNHSVHRSIGMRPIDVDQDNSQEVFERLFDGYPDERTLLNDVLKTPIEETKFKLNEIVRLRHYLPIMEHRYYPNYDDRYFRIAAIVRGYPKERYKLKLWEDNTPINGSFYSEELLSVKHGEYRVKVKGERGHGRNREVHLNFFGYPAKYDRWQRANTVRNLFK